MAASVIRARSNRRIWSRFALIYAHICAVCMYRACVCVCIIVKQRGYLLVHICMYVCIVRQVYTLLTTPKLHCISVIIRYMRAH